MSTNTDMITTTATIYIRKEYQKRPGTTNHGAEYEDAITTLYAVRLALNPGIKRMYIARNVDGFRAFNDLIIRVEDNTTTRLYALQLKHKPNPDALTPNSFMMKNASFSLCKYKNTYEDCIKKIIGVNTTLMESISTDDVSLCLLTNAKMCENRSLVMEVENGVEANCTVSKFQELDDFIDTSNGYYLFQANDVKSNYEEFLRLFKFYDSQVNSTEVKQRIIDVLKRKFGRVEESSVNEIIGYVSNNFSDDEKCSLLTKSETRHKLLKVLLLPLVINVSGITATTGSTLWTDIINSVDITIISTAADISKAIHLNEDGATMHISTQMDLLEKPKAKSMLLILTVNENFEYVSNVLNEFVDLGLKYIIICDKPNRLQLGEQFSVFKNLDCPIGSKLKTEMLQNIKVSLQGRQEVALYEILGQNFDELPKDLIKCFTSTFILSNLDSCLVLGRKLEFSCRNYIKRSFYKTSLENDVLYETGKNIFLINCDVQVNPERAIKLTHIDIQIIHEIASTNDKPIIIISTPGKLLSHFNDLEKGFCLSKFAIYCLEKRKNKFILLSCKGDISKLRKFVINEKPNSGSIFGEINEDCDNVIIEEHNILTDFNDAVTLITGIPGMGKSTTLKLLAKMCTSNTWVIYIELNKYTKVFYEKPHEMLLDPIEYFGSKNERYNDNSIQEDIYKYMKKKRKFTVFLDGFDEVSSTFTDTVLELILKFKQMGARVFVTSHPIAEQFLTNRMQVVPINMKPLSRKDISSYLSSQVEGKSHIIFKVCEASERVIWTPLHLKMFVTILNSPNCTEVFNIIDLYDMFIKEKYDIYLGKLGIETPQNLAHQLNRNKIKKEDDKKLALVVVYGKQLLIDHRVIDEEEFQSILTSINTCKERTGLVVGVNNDFPIFSHKTFAEYLAAKWLSENFQKPKFSEAVKVMYKVLAQKENEYTRIMFDTIMASECPIHLAIIDRNWHHLEKLCEAGILTEKNCLDKCNRSPLHVLWPYIIYDSFYNSSIDAKYVLLITNLILESLSKYKLKEPDLHYEIDFVPYFTKYFSSCISLLNYIFHHNYVYALDLFVEPHSSENSNFKNDQSFRHVALYNQQTNIINVWKGNSHKCTTYDYGEPVLYYLFYEKPHVSNVRILTKSNLDVVFGYLLCAVKSNYRDIVSILTKHYVDINYINPNSKKTVLHVACLNGYEEAIQFLIDNGADVNIRNEYGYTPIHAAAENGSSNIIGILIKNGAHCKVVDDKGESPYNLESMSHPERSLLLGEPIKIFRLDALQQKEAERRLKKAAGNLENFNIEEILNQMVLHDLDSPLLAAASVGCTALVQRLLDQVVNLTIQDKYGRNALFLASANGHVESVQCLLEHGVGVETASNTNFTPLQAAARGGHLDVLRILVENKANINHVDGENKTAFHYACYFGRTACVAFLMEQNANLQTPDNDGNTGMHLAAKRGHTLVVEMIVKVVLDGFTSNFYGENPIQLALKGGHTKCVTILQSFERNRAKHAFQGCIKLGLTELDLTDEECELADLINNIFSNLSYRVYDYGTAMHVAVLTENYAAIMYLMDSNIYLCTENREGFTPLDLARTCCYDLCLNILSREVQQEPDDGDIIQEILLYEIMTSETNLYLPVWLFNATVKNKLKSRMELFDINKLGPNGWGLLHSVTKENYFGFDFFNTGVTEKYQLRLQFLLDRGANINLKNKAGNTALHIACSYGNIEFAKLLIEKNANVNEVNNNNQTPLSLSLSRSNKKCMQFLLDHGANVHLKFNKKMTLLDIATVRGYISQSEKYKYL